MKKVLLFAVVIGGLAFTSCSKNDCECSDGGITITITEDEWKDLGGTGDFKDECEAEEECKLV